ncbi:metalloregulator ArsR/SmtB family transcription factor [Microbacterium terregens]|uniref:ArsR/SmtB family transcription factor n=1 Tax=Microbacterium terregens TaxID=69363 RepID=A0ABV5T601_9MICO
MSFDPQQRPLYEVKAGLFKGLSHPIRIRILELLSNEVELSVAQLQADTDLEASHLSQHLTVLRHHHLVVSDRRGSHVYYRLAYAEVSELLTTARGLLLRIVSADGARAADAAALPPVGSAT